MNKQITIRDVAKEAGVSRQTISRAFNDKGEISPETKQHVLDVAQRMGYRPSGLARSLTTNRTYTVGLLIPDISYHFYSLIAKGVETVSSAAGYGLYLANTLRDIQRETQALDTLWDRRVDGAILYASFLSPGQLAEYVERYQHVVFINCQTVPDGKGKIATINVDDTFGAQTAVAHLLENGHIRIAFLSGPEFSVSGRRRRAGYEQAFKAHGLTADPNLVYECFPDIEGGYEIAQQLLEDHPEVTAILAYNDMTAVGAMRACQDRGIKIPKEIAIIGFDDIPLASILRPSLTTVRIGKQDLGQQAMTTLLAMIEGKSDEIATEQIITPELVIRESAP